MPISANAMRLIMRQVHELVTRPVPGVQIISNDDPSRNSGSSSIISGNSNNSNNNSSIPTTDTLSELHVNIAGPEETPFAGGLFHVVFYFDDGYPSVPPRGLFRTKIFHPNIAEKGDICVNVLKRDWDPGLGLRHVITVVRCLLIEPNAESALNEEAARLLLEDYDAFKRKAEMMTKVHAMRGVRPPQLQLQQQRDNARTLGVNNNNNNNNNSGDLYNHPSQQQQQEKEDLTNTTNTTTTTVMGLQTGVMDSTAVENSAGSQLRNAPDSALNLRGVDNGIHNAVHVNSKKAVDKKRAALKRI